MTRITSKSRSSAVVACIMDMYPDVRKVGFRKAIHGVLPEAPADFIPDAYSIRPGEKAIDLIEVVDTNPIMRPKASLISQLWEHAMDLGWNVSVIGYDSCGGVMFQVSGMVFYPAYLRAHMGDEAGNAIPAALAVQRDLDARRP